ncbi:tRNA (guanine-N(1)-)-methyltransferase [Buchnera aphidicola (Chaitophorus sp. 3695)]
MKKKNIIKKFFINFKIITIFPEMFNSIINYGILSRAIKKKIIKLTVLNLRNFSKKKNKSVDDRPYGGGPGMIMSFLPLKMAIIKYIKKKKYYIIYLSPQGKKINQNNLKNFSKIKNIILICGRYQGIDQRFIKKFVDQELSIGDYILTGGELAAMVFIDAICRFIPGVIKKKNIKHQDSFSKTLLDYPHYTRPRIIDKMKVPDILLSGNHKKIKIWRLKKSIEYTLFKKPKLFKKKKFNAKEKIFLSKILQLKNKNITTFKK